MNKKINFAVIGAGHIGKRHAEMITRNNDANLVAICDILPKEELNLNYDVPEYYSIEELLDVEKNIDVVCIATPNGLHAGQALTALGSSIHRIRQSTKSST